MAQLQGIYAIVDTAEGDVVRQLEDVLASGIRLVQYRDKSGIDRALLAAVCDRAHAAGATLIVNDELAALDIADGIHLGQEDLDAIGRPALRERVGAKILGISTPGVDAAREAVRLGADYLGVGSVYPTSTKYDAGEPIGAEGVRRVVRAVDVPVAAIGGITLERIADVRATGASMAAVITAISRAPDRRAAARALVAAWAR